jgi:hypothetical protein
MMTAVYYTSTFNGEKVLLAAFLMKTDADLFIKSQTLINNLETQDLPTEAYTNFSKIRGYIQ